MLEVVFGESACGSLKVAQSYGKGKYIGGAVSVMVLHTDGAEPTAEEQQAAEKRARERLQREYENAIPLESCAEDVYCFALGLAIGDISDDGIGEKRQQALSKIMCIPCEDKHAVALQRVQQAADGLDRLIGRYRVGEDIRIWYSSKPDELCGMYWLMDRLRLAESPARVYAVRLPGWEYGEENTVISRNGWGEVGPGEWGRYASLQQEVRPVLRSAWAAEWSRLREENAPLRAVVNGRLQSVPEEFYDCFILGSIAAQPEEFSMARAIGDVLGKYRPGIGDEWIACRIDHMIHMGLLEVIKEAPEGEMSYSRMLRKAASQIKTPSLQHI